MYRIEINTYHGWFVRDENLELSEVRKHIEWIKEDYWEGVPIKIFFVTEKDVTDEFFS